MKTGKLCETCMGAIEEVLYWLRLNFSDIHDKERWKVFLRGSCSVETLLLLYINESYGIVCNLWICESCL